MRSGRGWRPIVAGAVVLAMVAAVVAGLAWRHGASRSTAAPTAAPAARDVAAARACQAFSVYLADAEKGEIPAAVGARLVTDAGVLLRGASAASAAGRSLPRWASLGSELLAAADDVVDHKAKALNSDGAAAAASCESVPAAAARAGGYRRSG